MKELVTKCSLSSTRYQPVHIRPGTYSRHPSHIPACPSAPVLKPSDLALSLGRSRVRVQAVRPCKGALPAPCTWHSLRLDQKECPKHVLGVTHSHPQASCSQARGSQHFPPAAADKHRSPGEDPSGAPSRTPRSGCLCVDHLGPRTMPQKTILDATHRGR